MRSRATKFMNVKIEHFYSLFPQQPYQSLLTKPINVYHSLLLIMARTFCLSVFLTNCLSVSLSLCLSVSLSLCPSVFPSPCLLDYLSLCLSFSFTFTYLFFLFNSLFIVILKPFFIHSLANNWPTSGLFYRTLQICFSLKLLSFNAVVMLTTFRLSDK